ncbi:mitogen activated protein kinase kinase [Ceratobasidium sp. AG-Ba]|nr:mitogen activated protein kinase kinase [Ceratobasidium sp. AG-Ba]QRW11267.1 mitogen activated protein kinase kinase [Ceratobasidium sp. AG-Ba]
MGPRRALPTPPNRQHQPQQQQPELLDPPPEMIAALGPPPSAVSPPVRPPSFQPGSFLAPNGAPLAPPSATPLATPMPSPGFVPFQAPPPPPPLPGREDESGGPTPSELMRSSRMGLYANSNPGRPQLSLRGNTPPAQTTAPLKLKPKPRVEVPSVPTPSELDSADADDERVFKGRPNAAHRTSYDRSSLGPSNLGPGASNLGPGVDSPSPGPMVGRIGGGGVGRPKLGLRTSSGSALPDDDAPAPQLQPADPGASLTSLRPKLQLPGASSGGRPKLGLSLPSQDGGAKPGLKLDLSAMRGQDSEDEVDYSYYGKPTAPRQNSLSLGAGSESFPSDSSAATLRPPSMTTAVPQGTMHHAGPGRAGDGLDEVRRAINELRMPSRDTYDESTEAEADETGVEDNNHQQQQPQQRPQQPEGGEAAPEEWSDEMFDTLQRLGEGAGGAVSKVRDKRTGKIMARKTIPTGTVPARQLLRELQFSQLNHPNLVASYGAYISSNPEAGPKESDRPAEIHILMEFCEGGALDAIARQMKIRHANVRIGEKVIARLAEGVLKGLDYLHSNKITHRDIKPSNIVVTRTGIVKLCDFGVSGQLEGSLASTFTGTSWYMAPERITGHPYSIRADVWSTGLTFLELAQNRFPYPPDLGPIELLTYIVNGEVPELDDEPGDENGIGAITWSDGMKSFIKQCLRIDDKTRPPPRDMLLHPWIQESMARKLDMAKWIREVWGWEKPVRSKRASAQQPPQEST